MLTLEEVLSDFAAYIGCDELDKIDINSKSGQGKSPLHWMVVLGDNKGIELLVEAGANIDVQDSKGNTPLHEAVICRHHTTVYTLVELGANRSMRNKDGFTPKELAIADENEAVIAVFNSWNSQEII
jgi:ankyrin repeat protein